jgi:hypothetical protein
LIRTERVFRVLVSLLPEFVSVRSGLLSPL